MNSTQNKTLYKVTQYDGQQISSNKLTREELNSIDPERFDHYLSLAFGKLCFRDRNGRWKSSELDLTGLGNTGLVILKIVQDFSGEYLTPRDIYNQTDIYSLLTPNNLSARWMNIRKVHDESFYRPNFFLSRRTGGMGVAWNKDKTWIRIERVSN